MDRKGVVIATNDIGTIVIRAPIIKMYEEIRIPGEHGFLRGEIVEINQDHGTAQMFDGVGGIRIGAEAQLTGHPLIAEAAPTLGLMVTGLGSSIKGLSTKYLRAGEFKDPFEGLEVDFTPAIKTGTIASPGTVLGHVSNNGYNYTISVPSHIHGQITYIAPAGKINVREAAAKVQNSTNIHNIDLISRHPVRQPRPVRKWSRAQTPLLTGRRTLDAPFTLIQGGKFMVMGDAGTGKTWFTQAMAKFTQVDCVIVVQCGERSGESTEVIVTYTETGLMHRTDMVINTSAMSPAARGQSVRYGLALAEAYRDMGLNVLVIADSLSRQGQGDRESWGALGKMPGKQSFPVDLASVLALTYERGGIAETLSGQTKSITIVTAVSPDGGDIEGDAIGQLASQYTDGCIVLSKEIANRGFFPAVAFTAGTSATKTRNPIDLPVLQKFYTDNNCPRFLELSTQVTALVSAAEGPLKRQLETVGPRRMSSEDYRNKLLGDMFREIFFNQMGSEHDQNTPLSRMNLMLEFCGQLIEKFPILADKDQSAQLAQKITSQAYGVLLLEKEQEAEAAYQRIIGDNFV